MMARINSFAEKDVQRTSVHEEVEATFHIFEQDGEIYLQLDTYGAAGRQIVGKVSQPIQLGKQGRNALRMLLSRFDE